LNELAVCLTDAGFDITSAHIEVVGAMAVDVFYVRGADVDDKIKKTLRGKLLDILRDPVSHPKAA
jgi:UTP:GlnB (protein PII) uridylyltransferase